MYKTIKNRKLGIFIQIFIWILIANSAFAQSTKFTAETKSNLILSGTSNVHDWQMEADVNNCFIVVETSDNSNSIELNEVSFQLPITNLKSEHKKLDDNAYKALKASDFPEIRFTGDPNQKLFISNGKITGVVNGILEIAGTKKKISLKLSGKVENKSQLAFQLSVPLVMEDYNVEPPVLMFGAISTGSSIKIVFELFFKESNQLSIK